LNSSYLVPPINVEGERGRKREIPSFFNHLCYAMVDDDIKITIMSPIFFPA